MISSVAKSALTVAQDPSAINASLPVSGGRASEGFSPWSIAEGFSQGRAIKRVRKGQAHHQTSFAPSSDCRLISTLPPVANSLRYVCDAREPFAPLVDLVDRQFSIGISGKMIVSNHRDASGAWTVFESDSGVSAGCPTRRPLCEGTRVAVLRGIMPEAASAFPLGPSGMRSGRFRASRARARDAAAPRRARSSIPEASRGP